MMQAAEQGRRSTLDRADGAGRSPTSQGAAGWTGLDPVTASVAGLLSARSTSFTAGREDVSAGKRLKSRSASIERRDQGLGPARAA